MINKVVLVGNLTRDPQFIKTQSGISNVRFTLAINRRFSNKDEADFISCVAWRQTADFVSQYAKKGQTVALVGHLTTGSYDDKATGKKIYTTDVTCDSVQLINSKGNSKTPQKDNMYGQDSMIHDD